MEKVTYSIEDGIAQITMDDGKANAMNWGFFVQKRGEKRSYLFIPFSV